MDQHIKFPNGQYLKARMTKTGRLIYDKNQANYYLHETNLQNQLE